MLKVSTVSTLRMHLPIVSKRRGQQDACLKEFAFFSSAKGRKKACIIILLKYD